MAIGDDVAESVGRVFEVLQLYDARRDPLRAADVERALRHSQPSTLALLKSMVRTGYLAFDRRDRTYLPTMRVATPGHWLETAFHGEGRLAPLLPSAIGLTALSARSHGAIRTLAARLDRHTRGDAPKVDPEAVLQRVRRTCSAGHGMGYDVYLPGIGAIARVLQPDSRLRPIVHSAGGPVDRIQAREGHIVKATRAAPRRHLGN